MRPVYVIGTGLTSFGKFPDARLRGLSTEAAHAALKDAETSPDRVELVAFGNALAGALTGQSMVRGQVALVGSGLDGTPVINVENACASGASAFHHAWLAVAAGSVDVALALGAEKMSGDRARAFSSLLGAVDQDELPDDGPAEHSLFMEIYAREARAYMAAHGATQEDFAAVAVKNHRHGAANPKAQYGGAFSTDDVLGARSVVDPLTVLMCAPVGDGAAGVLLSSVPPESGPRVVVRACALAGGSLSGTAGDVVRAASSRAREDAGIDLRDVDVVECHDATAPAELVLLEQLGLAEPGEALRWQRDGVTAVGGRLPVNPSGGLQSRGHPVGATGLAQVVELADQLRGRAAGRQVEGARVALAENAGGYLGQDAAAAVVTVLST